MKRCFLIIYIFFAVAFFTSCGNKTEAPDGSIGNAEAAIDEHENEDAVTLTAEQIKTIGIEIGSIEKRSLPML